MYTLLREHAESLRQKASAFTSELIRTPSVSYNESEVAKLVEMKMKELGYDKVITDDFGNVFGILYGYENGPTLLLNSHMDTVAPDENAVEWKGSPYSGKIMNGKIYGVGSADCKSGLAVQIYAAHMLLHRALIPLRGNVIVAATVSEENGLSLGVQHLISKSLADMKIKVDYAILGEPTNLGLFYGHDGWAKFNIGLDSPNPNFLKEAANAIYQNLFNASKANQNDGNEDFMSVHQPEFENNYQDARIILNRRLYKNEDTGKLIENIKDLTIQNVKEKKSVNLDIKLREEIQKLANGDIVQVRYLSSAWETSPFSPLMDRARQALSSAKCKTFPGKWRLPRIGMGTAGSVLTKKFNIPTIGYGPGNEDVIHAAGEYVEADNIVEGILGTASIIHNLVGIPVFGWTSDLDF